MTLWSGRFDTEPDPAAFDFGVSFGFDRALFEDDVTGSLAWAEALAAGGVLAKEDAAAIKKDSKPSSMRDGAIRPPSLVRTKTFTASSSGSSWSASAMRAGGFTPAARATSRSRSTCGSTCAGAFRRFNRL